MNQYASQYTGGNSQSSGGSSGDYQKYMKQYAGQYVDGGSGDYMKQYAGAYMGQAAAFY